MPWSPDTALNSHDRLRNSGFPVVSIMSSRSASDARAYLCRWLAARQRSIVTAPLPSQEAALAAYRYRCREWKQLLGLHANREKYPPTLLFVGELDQIFDSAYQIAQDHPVLPVAVATTTDALLGCLLNAATRPELVSTGLQGIVAVEESEQRIIDTVAKRRNVGAFLRGPCEGLIYYMLEARVETKGLFEANVRLPKVKSSGSYEVDIACISAKLVIEIDGPEHDVATRREQDERKQRDLQQLGYRVRRFSNNDVVSDPVSVWRLIHEQLEFARAEQQEQDNANAQN